ncbi:peptide transporter family 1 isoform X2 [Lepeophtheirus salmonis]|nr:peptide transporter family 1-like isoform X2 [Lepeophtheirus salmonis]
MVGYSSESVDSVAKTLYHTFVFLSYFTALIGAFLADSFWGKFKTIFYISIVYAIGQAILTFGSIPDESNWTNLPREWLSYIGLLLIAFGTGGIKPCVVSFGADQFKLPEQQKELDTFFDVFYASINIGSLLSTFFTPMLRNVHCYGSDHCFPLAFGVPSILMVLAVMFFLVGKSFYKRRIPESNIVYNFFNCLWVGFKNRKNPYKSEHLDASDSNYSWLYKAELNPKYDVNFIEDVMAVLKVSVLMIPFPIFWSLYDQQGSQWLIQATKMNGAITESFTLLPDQTSIFNAFFVLFLIPVFNKLIYPVFDRCGILTKPLSKIACGGMFLALAFVIAGILEIVLDRFPNKSIHMAWLIPQYFCLTCGEIMFSITSLQFVFTEAPEKMKTVVQALYLLTTAFGNFIDIMIMGIFDSLFSRAMESFVFSAIMFMDMLILLYLARNYKHYRPRKN